MNVVLLVVDSLRSCSLRTEGAAGPATPFLDRLARQTAHFRQAHASECWTLPAHLSMFTGRLPSEHGAHFQTMAYTRPEPTIAEILAAAGFHTALVTRNSIFDGSLPGVTRGFQQQTRPLAPISGLNPLSLVLALSKRHFRRQIRTTGFFHPSQRASLEFLKRFARATVPADREALVHVLDQMQACRRRGQAYFIFANLYDVHAPYSPEERSIFRAPGSLRGLEELGRMALVMPKLGGHRYLRPGFRVAERSRRMLLDRYHDAIALMDAKLEAFYDAARGQGLLDDTVLVITSDHGEAFGEHDLYLHDASAYETHLRVPLFVHHPACAPSRVDDVVSTRDLFGLLLASAQTGTPAGTILDPDYRARHPIALAEHFHYPHLPDALPRYRQNLRAAISRTTKVIRRDEGVVCFDLTRDAAEAEPMDVTTADVASRWRADGAAAEAASAALAHLGVGR